MHDAKREKAHEIDMSRADILALTTEIVSAQVSHTPTDVKKLPDLIQSVFEKLRDLAGQASEAEVELVPAVPIKKSITDAYIICLEDGKKLKMLKRHLMTAYGMTPAEYRSRWGLDPLYPMVAPNYAARRRDLALAIGLGRKPVADAAKQTASKTHRSAPSAKRKAA